MSLCLVSDFSFSFVLCFSSKNSLQARRTRVIIVDCSMLSYIDVTGAHCLTTLAACYKKMGIQMLLSGVAAHVVHIMNIDGNFHLGIPKSHIYITIHDAVLRAVEEMRQRARANTIDGRAPSYSTSTTNSSGDCDDLLNETPELLECSSTNGSGTSDADENVSKEVPGSSFPPGGGGSSSGEYSKRTTSESSSSSVSVVVDIESSTSSSPTEMVCSTPNTPRRPSYAQVLASHLDENEETSLLISPNDSTQAQIVAQQVKLKSDGCNIDM